MGYMVGEQRSLWLQARVTPSTMGAIDGHVGAEGRSVWLRELVGWALEHRWRAGQDWVRKPYGQVEVGSGPGPAIPVELPAVDNLSKMEFARAALALAEQSARQPKAPVVAPVAPAPVAQRGFGDVPPDDDWEPA